MPQTNTIALRKVDEEHGQNTQSMAVREYVTRLRHECGTDETKMTFMRHQCDTNVTLMVLV